MSGFLFATLLVVVPSSSGLVRCVILYFLISFVIKKILAFLVAMLSPAVLLMEFPSSFYQEPGSFVPSEVTLPFFFEDGLFLQLSDGSAEVLDG